MPCLVGRAGTGVLAVAVEDVKENPADARAAAAHGAGDDAAFLCGGRGGDDGNKTEE